MVHCIAAVAIGDSGPAQRITAAIGADTPGVRNYVPGLITELSNRGIQIGTDYVIDYRERKESDLKTPIGRNEAFAGSDLIYCMSTTVVGAAQTFTATVPIVGIVSDHTAEGFDGSANICGVSARRHQKATDCFRSFLNAVPGLTEVILLHKPEYNPSEQARAHITDEALRRGFNPPNIIQASTPDELNRVLNSQLPTSTTTGLVVLPADLFFGCASRIIAAAQNKLATCFFAPDWVKANLPSAVCGYGVSQLNCGTLLAERVHYIWTHNNAIPNDPRFTEAGDDVFEWYASDAAAAAAGVDLGAGVRRR